MDEEIHLKGEHQRMEMREQLLKMDDNRSVNMPSRQRVIRIIYLVTAVDLTCMFMQFAIVPYLATSLGLDPVGFGYLQTVFGVLQLLGGPIFGRFADQFGARAALTLSFVAGCLYFLLLSLSTSIPLLFLSRIPCIFMHGLPGAQMVITDLTAPDKRADALGKLGLCFGIGIIIGSSLGGALVTKFGIYFPCYVALIGILVCAVITLIFIPAQTKPQMKQHAESQSVSQSSSVFNLKEIMRLLKLPGVMETFLIKLLSGLPSGMFLIMFSIISINFFGLDAAQSGYLMSYVGVLQMVVQGVVVGRLTSRYTEQTLLLLCVFVFCGVGIAMVLMTNIFHYCIIVLPMVFSFSTVGIITDIILTKAVPVSDTGNTVLVPTLSFPPCVLTATVECFAWFWFTALRKYELANLWFMLCQGTFLMPTKSLSSAGRMPSSKAHLT